MHNWKVDFLEADATNRGLESTGELDPWLATLTPLSSFSKF
jgi:hypothetical protein